tara:strand:- start:856 stop:2970 length:2115 start_codon:yes stop_codon:yes gene_type:complete
MTALIVQDFIDKEIVDMEYPPSSISNELITPCLKEFSFARRETGWFRSSAIRAWAFALEPLIKKDIKMQFLISPQVDKTTYLALKNATRDQKLKIYENYSDAILNKALLLKSNPFHHSKETGNTVGQILSYLVLSGKLEFKFIDVMNTEYLRVYEDNLDEEEEIQAELNHIKKGYFKFPCGNVLAYEGSFNESGSGLTKQGESCQILLSTRDDRRVESLRSRIDDKWCKKRQGVRVRGLSKKILDQLEIIKRDNPYNAAGGTIDDFPPSGSGSTNDSGKSKINFKPWEHQEFAIDTFLNSSKNDFSIDEALDRRGKNELKGILQMATGTGKTKTALEIARLLFNDKKINKLLVVSDQTKSLTEQWREELYNWKKETNINLTLFDSTKSDIFSDFKEDSAMVMRSEAKSLIWMIENISEIDKLLIIFDEVHGFATPTVIKEMEKGKIGGVSFTLGLSATPEREYDDFANKFMEDEIGETIFDFGIEDAIRGGVACPFDYIEIPVEMSDEDKQKRASAYSLCESKIKEDPKGKITYEKERNITVAKIYGGASNKPSTFNNFLSKNPELLKHSIIYCETMEQGDEIGALLREKDLNWSPIYRDSDEQLTLNNLEKRKIDCIVTCIKLSQGIDINSLDKIILVASPSAKLKTIQRIGRCIRIDKQNPDKIAKVFDMVLYNDLGKKDIISREEERKKYIQALSEVRPNG